MPVRHRATTWTLYGCFSASPQHPHYKCTGDTYIALLPQAIWIYQLTYDIDVSNLLHINSTHMVNFMVTHKIIINTDSVLVPDRHQPGHCPHTMLMVLGKTAASPLQMHWRYCSPAVSQLDEWACIWLWHSYVTHTAILMPRIWSIVNFMGVQQGHHRYSQRLDAS